MEFVSVQLYYRPFADSYNETLRFIVFVIFVAFFFLQIFHYFDIYYLRMFIGLYECFVKFTSSTSTFYLHFKCEKNSIIYFIFPFIFSIFFKMLHLLLFYTYILNVKKFNNLFYFFNIFFKCCIFYYFIMIKILHSNNSGSM